MDTIFRDVCEPCFTANTRGGEPLRFLFCRSRGQFRWTVGVASRLGSAYGLKSGIHAAGSTSHLHALTANDLGAVLHRRLHGRSSCSDGSPADQLTRRRTSRAPTNCPAIPGQDRDSHVVADESPASLCGAQCYVYNRTTTRYLLLLLQPLKSTNKPQ